jgi:hypothetical protein
MSSDDFINARDWRRRPPLRLLVTKKLDIHWCWIKCTRCPQMRAGAIAPYVIRWGPDGWRTCSGSMVVAANAAGRL